MNNLIEFYLNLYPVNNKRKYFLNDIVEKWDDYKLETNSEYFSWIFPSDTTFPVLTTKDIKRFQIDPLIRKNVFRVSLRMLLFYGFVPDNVDVVKQIKPLNRRDKGVTIGLFSTKNFKKLEVIMEFLRIINMEFISSMYYLALCKSMKTNYVFFQKVLKDGVLNDWMSTQNFLIDHIHNYDISLLTRDMIRGSDDEGVPHKLLYESDSAGDEGDDGDWEEIPSELLYEGKDKVYDDVKELKKCDITGLNYTGNSCYMDSALMATFAIPNKVIQENILEKNLNSLKTQRKRRWSSCSDDIDTDIKRRQDIQKILNEITNSIRGVDNVKKVKNCSRLRQVIRNCPGSQPFHGTDTQDSGEFLAYLFNVFQVDVAKTVRKTYGSNDVGNKPVWTLVRTVKDDNSSPIVDVSAVRLQEINKGYDITKFTKQKQDSYLDENNVWTPDHDDPNISYNRRKEIFKILESPIVIFNLTRTYGEMKFRKPKTKDEKLSGKGSFAGITQKNVWKKISAPETMVLHNRELSLSAIVVHTGGAHYVANFKCDGQWYWFDDNPGSSKYEIRHIGSYENMLKTSPRPLTHGTLFFYT